MVNAQQVSIQAIEMAIEDVTRRLFDEHEARQQSVEGEWWADVEVADAFIAHYDLTLRILRSDLARLRGKVAA